MPLTPEQIAKIRQKEAELSDAQKRAPNVNYYEGWFHVTLNVRDEVPVLGYLAGNAEAADDSEDAPRCVLTDLGKAVIESWNRMPEIYPFVEIDMAIAMPEHFHGLIHLLPGNKKHLGQMIKGFMIGCSHGYWDTLGIPWRDMTYEKGVRTPQYNDPDHTHSFRGPALFVHGYNDTEPITPEEVETKRQYIRNNPRKRLITRSKPDFFRISRNRRSATWTLDRVSSAIAADHFFGRNPDKYRQVYANVSARLKRMPEGEGLALDLIGNQKLLIALRRVSLICHRADAALFEQQKETTLKAAREGAVVVGAFINPKEREIMKLLMVEQLPIISITDNGFSERYRPSGKAFYATAEHRLLEISPWTYLFQREERDDEGNRIASITREMCLTMNALARIISGVEDGWWKE